MKKMELEDIQKVSLAILKHIHRICEEHNIKYTIMYGTLIGAIRHKGYIPWDDDVDIAMRRDDYEKFLKIMKELESDQNPYYIDHFSTSRDYPYYIMRVCDNRYHAAFENTVHVSGIFVDVYPLDDTGDDIPYWKNIHTRLESLKKCMILSTYKNLMYGSSFLHKICNIPLAIYSRLRGVTYFMHKIDKIAQQFNGTRSGFIGIPAWDIPEQFKEEWFEDLMLVPFEDTEVYAPRHYDEVLRTTYGEYMNLPPESEQVPHHNYVAYMEED